MTTVTALFDTRDHAMAAAEQLQGLGITPADISIIANNADEWHPGAVIDEEVTGGILTGVGAGAALGGAEASGMDAGGSLGPFMQEQGGLGGLGGAPAAIAAGPTAVQPGPALGGQGSLGGLGGQAAGPIAAAPWMRMPGGSNNQLLSALLRAYR